MRQFYATSFNGAYRQLLSCLDLYGEEAQTRRGETLTELNDVSFHLTDPYECICTCREPSLDYLEKEFDFYISGSDQLKDALKLSKFWKKCSDDGVTVTSNYGKLIFHDKNKKGITQFEHAYECLLSNPQSKKAVATVYDKEHAFISKDNPCTMFIRFRIDLENRLHLSVYMRSSDVYFGLPYDVPFFCFVQHHMLTYLKSTYPLLTMGTYTHTACSLHYYERHQKQILEIVKQNLASTKDSKTTPYTKNLFKESSEELSNRLFLHNYEEIATPTLQNCMAKAFQEADKSTCLKKKVGALLLHRPTGKNLVSYGGSYKGACTTCIRDTKARKFYGDSCPSVHSEMKVINEALKIGYDFSECTLFVTHGPCDACLKLCDYVGIKKIYYTMPYKTDYTYWDSIDIRQLIGVDLLSN